MSGRDDLAAAREAIMARKREELGEPPTPEELLAWRDGRLNAAARERLEARIAVYPDAARALADLAAFPDIEPGPGVPDLSDDEVDAGWGAFRQRLEQLPRPLSKPVSFRPVPVRPARSPVWQMAAAILLLSIGLGAGYFAGRESTSFPPSSPLSPARNVEIVELEPGTGDGFRASAAPFELPETSEALLLSLVLPGTESFSVYEAEIVDREGTKLWSGGGLYPSLLGTIQVSFPRMAFTPGTWRIDLFGLDRAGGRKKVARYELQVR